MGKILNPPLDPVPGAAPGTFYHLTMTGLSDDMPIGLFLDPHLARAFAINAGYIDCEPVPAWYNDPTMPAVMLAKNTVRGATITWGMGPSGPLGYKIAKYKDGRLADVVIFSWDGCPDINDAAGRRPVIDDAAVLRAWCETNWHIPTGTGF